MNKFIYYTYNGYCFNKQNAFSVLSIGRVYKSNVISRVFQIDKDNFKLYKELPTLELEQQQPTVVNVNGAFYVLGGHNHNQVENAKMYTWQL